MKAAERRRSPLGTSYLAAAPELAALALLDRALVVAVRALLAEHPTLATELVPGCVDPPTLRHARRLLRDARPLRRALARYRLAVRCALVPPPSDSDDLPF